MAPPVPARRGRVSSSVVNFAQSGGIRTTTEFFELFEVYSAIPFCLGYTRFSPFGASRSMDARDCDWPA